MVNRIGKLRRDKGLTLQGLADRAGTTASTIRKLERGDMRLTVDWMQRIANGLDCEVRDLIEERDMVVAGLSDEGSPYIAEPGDPLAALAKADTMAPYRISGGHLDNLGIMDGDVVIIDISAEATKKLEPLGIYIAQVYSSNSLDAVTVVRQFVPPALLITNSQSANLPSLELSTDDVAIKGRIISHHRALLIGWNQR